jgi:hypothetical protein
MNNQIFRGMERLTVVRTRPGQVLALVATLALLLAVCATFLPPVGFGVAVLVALAAVLLFFWDDPDIPPAAGMVLA